MNWPLILFLVGFGCLGTGFMIGIFAEAKRGG